MSNIKSRKTRKIAAIAAGVLVVGVAGTYTLASWTDQEWVWGGADRDGTNVGTASFNVQQDTGDGWTDEESANGGQLEFTVNASALTPGDTVFAPLQLRTDTDSLAARVTLQGASERDADGTPVQTSSPLWNVLDVAVYTSTQGLECSEAGIDSWGAALTAEGTLSTVGAATASQTLEANAAAEQYYCFTLTLPNTTEIQANAALRGATVVPVWNFQAESVDAAEATEPAGDGTEN